MPPLPVRQAIKNVNGAEAIAETNNDSYPPEKRSKMETNQAPSGTAGINSTLLSASGGDTSLRARRVMKEFMAIQKAQNEKETPTFTVELVDDKIFEWHAKLYVVDPDSMLAKDMARMNIPFILLHLSFPNNFPFEPPFMRVVEPVILGGFVLTGGAICMELLSPKGWSAAYTIEALLMQFAATVVKGGGRISESSGRKFDRNTAERVFKSVMKTHAEAGWGRQDMTG